MHHPLRRAAPASESIEICDVEPRSVQTDGLIILSLWRDAMKPKNFLFRFLLFSLLLTISTEMASAAPFAYIANACDASVTVVNTSNDAVLTPTIAVGNGPSSVVVNPTGTR